MPYYHVQQELFEELDAFNPRWREDYATTEAAAIAAGVHGLWLKWCLEQGRNMTSCAPSYDVLGVVKKQQELERRSKLPFKLASIGAVKIHTQYRED